MVKYIITLIVVATISGYSQLDKSNYYSYGESLYSEVLTLPYETEDSSRVVVMAKTAVESINFTKVTDGENFGKYIGVYNLQIKFKNNQGIIKERVKLVDTVYFDKYEDTQSKTIFLESTEVLVLQNGIYDVSFEFDIKNNSTNNTQTHKIDFTNKEPLYSPILLNTNREDVYVKLDPFLLDNTVSFDAKGCKIIIPSINLEDANYTYKISKQNEIKDTPLVWDNNNTIEGICELIKSIDFTFGNKYSDVKFSIERNSDYSALDFNIPVEKILPGVYKLEIFKNNDILQTLSFDIRWQNRPISINNIEYAIEMLQYIADEKKVEKLLDSDEKQTEFLNWWKDKDPTPYTPFNEAIQQYYSRVDYAFFSFKTISESDGALTDRGKIFILKAFPSRILEAFENNETLVKWQYENIKKEYVFELIKAGDYRLVKINNL